MKKLTAILLAGIVFNASIEGAMAQATNGATPAQPAAQTATTPPSATSQNAAVKPPNKVDPATAKKTEDKAKKEGCGGAGLNVNGCDTPEAVLSSKCSLPTDTKAANYKHLLKEYNDCVKKVEKENEETAKQAYETSQSIKKAKEAIKVRTTNDLALTDPKVASVDPKQASAAAALDGAPGAAQKKGDGFFSKILHKIGSTIKGMNPTAFKWGMAIGLGFGGLVFLGGFGIVAAVATAAVAGPIASAVLNKMS